MLHHSFYSTCILSRYITTLWFSSLYPFSLMQFPYICSYQEANYTIVVLKKSTTNNFEEGPFQYVDRDEEHIRIIIQDGLRPNWNYTATVIVETVAGSINSSIYFSKHPWDSCRLHTLSHIMPHDINLIIYIAEQHTTLYLEGTY